MSFDRVPPDNAGDVSGHIHGARGGNLQQSTKLPGSALLIAAAGFALLSVGDAVVKSIAGEWPGTGVAALRFAFGATALGGLLFYKQGRAGFICPSPAIQVARGVCAGLGAVCFFLAIYVMPLAEATVIEFLNPMLVPVLSAVILHERAPRAAWIATIVAFIGVLIVLRPNVVAIGWAGLLPLATAFGMAMMIVLNRMVAGRASVLQMQFLISIFALVTLLIAAVAGHLSGVAAFHIGWPSPSVVLRCAIVAITATTAHALIYMATERASAGAIAPSVYVQLIVALALGLIFFGNIPDPVAFGGAAIIIGAGLYLWRRSD